MILTPCHFCGYLFDQEGLGLYGCCNCYGEGLDDEPMTTTHKCPHCDKPINIGQLLGSATSEAKTAAARANANKPPKPGSRPRGRPPKQPLDDLPA